MSLCLHCLIQFAALVHLFLHKNKICGLRHFLNIICQIHPRAFEKSGIFKYKQPALCKKRQRFRQVNDFLDIHALPFIIGVIHRIAIRKHCLDKPLLILFLQIIFLSIKKIYLLKLSCF